MNNDTLIENITSKVCTKCGEEKPLNEYSKQRNGKFGLTARCKKCDKDYRGANKEHYKEYRESHNGSQTQYRESNKGIIKEYQKEYRESNIEHIKELKREYHITNKETINKSQKEYYQTNKETIKEYCEINKERIKEYRREYVKTRRSFDSKFRIKLNLSCRLSNAYRRSSITKKYQPPQLYQKRH
jgi:hypothetical protein